MDFRQAIAAAFLPRTSRRFQGMDPKDVPHTIPNRCDRRRRRGGNGRYRMPAPTASRGKTEASLYTASIVVVDDKVLRVDAPEDHSAIVFARDEWRSMSKTKRATLREVYDSRHHRVRGARLNKLPADTVTALCRRGYAEKVENGRTLLLTDAGQWLCAVNTPKPKS